MLSLIYPCVGFLDSDSLVAAAAAAAAAAALEPTKHTV